MSWGERSCIYYGRCILSTPKNCNISCLRYTWDKVKTPDTFQKDKKEMDSLFYSNNPMTKNQKKTFRKKLRRK